MDPAHVPVSLDISLLGPPRARVDGVLLQVDTRKAVALLAYLAVTGRPHARDSLAGLLWADYDQDRARAALRRTLSVLRRGLGGGFVVADGRGIGLVTAGADCDVWDFRRLAAEGDLAGAAAAYAGDFMAGFGLRDAPEFDEWQSAEADALRRELSRVLERLVRTLGERGEHALAIEHAHRWVGLDDLNETAHRELMRLSVWTGDRAGALRQYRRCAAVLERELGVPPLEETTELYRAIREDRAEPPPAPAGEPADAPPELPLVGRDRELDVLDRVRASAITDGRVAIVEGEPGVGKTRLAEAFADRVRAGGGVVLRVRCHPDEASIAYGPVVELVRAAGDPDAAPHHLAEAGRLVPELAAGLPPPPPLDGPGARARFYDALAHLITARARLVFVDDVHWADDASVEFLSYLGRRLAGHPLVVLLAWRTADVPPGHPLRRLHATPIALGRLGRADVTALVHAANGDDELAARLFRETEGLPLFLVEYLAAGGEGLPAGVRESVRARVAALGPLEQQVLAAAAVIGRTFDLDAARAASGRGDEETVGAIEELVRRGLVAEVGTTQDGRPSYDFGHDKTRELVYDETSLARRSLLHRRVADALAQRRTRGAAALVAHHYRLAGRGEDAARFHREAGEHARALYANGEAIEHFRAALALADADEPELHAAIGALLTRRGEYRDALAALETAAALRLDPETSRRLGDVHHRLGDWESAESHYVEAIGALDDDPAAAAGVWADRALNARRRAEDTSAAAHAERALELARRSGDARALAHAHNVCGVLASGAAAREHLERSLELARTLDDPDARAAALNNLALACGRDGDYDRAVALASEALSLCESSGDRHREAALHNNLADLLHASGHGEEAMVHLKQAVAIFAEVGEPDVLHPEIWKLTEW